MLSQGLRSPPQHRPRLIAVAALAAALRQRRGPWPGDLFLVTHRTSESDLHLVRAPLEELRRHWRYRPPHGPVARALPWRAKGARPWLDRVGPAAARKAIGQGTARASKAGGGAVRHPRPGRRGVAAGADPTENGGGGQRWSPGTLCDGGIEQVRAQMSHGGEEEGAAVMN